MMCKKNPLGNTPNTIFDKSKGVKKLMDNNNYSQNKRHINRDERAQIEILLKQKKSISEIARLLGRDKSVISREIKRNSVEQMDSELRTKKKYFADAAQQQYEERRLETGCKYKLEKATEIVEYIEKKIKEEKWSPDAAIGRASLEYPEWEPISTKTFYNYIDMNLVNVKPIDLHLKVRLRLKTKRVRNHKKFLGKSIEQRPENVNNREELGHWEMDTVVGIREKSSVLLTLTERVTRCEIIQKIDDRTSASVIKGLDEIKTRLTDSFTTMFKSITCDNGSEFSNSIKMEDLLNVPIYFAHPYSSFERGTNENHNGIIRRFIPKGKSIDDISQKLIDRAENFMNNLPRKILGYLTPIECLAKLLTSA